MKLEEEKDAIYTQMK